MATEQEARTKWCPFIQVRLGGVDPDWSITNRGEDVNTKDACNCIASGCMAWRWRDGEYEFRFTREGEGLPNGWEPWPLQPDEVPAYNGAMTRWRRLVTERRGYCGLAGVS